MPTPLTTEQLDAAASFLHTNYDDSDVAGYSDHKYLLRARDRHRMAETPEGRLGELRHRDGAMAVD